MLVCIFLSFFCAVLAFSFLLWHRAHTDMNGLSGKSAMGESPQWTSSIARLKSAMSPSRKAGGGFGSSLIAGSRSGVAFDANASVDASVTASEKRNGDIKRVAKSVPTQPTQTVPRVAAYPPSPFAAPLSHSTRDNGASSISSLVRPVEQPDAVAESSGRMATAIASAVGSAIARAVKEVEVEKSMCDQLRKENAEQAEIIRNLERASSASAARFPDLKARGENRGALLEAGSNGEYPFPPSLQSAIEAAERGDMEILYGQFLTLAFHCRQLRSENIAYREQIASNTIQYGAAHLVASSPRSAPTKDSMPGVPAQEKPSAFISSTKASTGHSC